MKPLKLKFRGIKSFSDWAEIDFERLLSGGIFGIFGDTGAGKSTILDCIGFVLYGKINCIGKEGTTMSDILNFHSEKGEVEFDFASECNGKRSTYRIERSINKKGLQKATLYEREEDKLLAIAEGPAQVNKKIEEEIVGISFDDFKKCIALPQGEFSEFLHAGRKDRLELISKLFSLDEYGAVLVKRVNARAAKVEGVKNTLEGKLSNYLQVTPEAIEEETAKAQSLREECLAQEAKEASQAQAVQTAEKNFQLMQDWQNAQNDLSSLQPKKAEMEFLRGLVEKLRVAQTLCSIEEERSTANKKYLESVRKVEQLRTSEKQLQSRIEGLNSDMGALNFEQKIEEAQKKLTVRQAAKKDFDRLDELKRELSEFRVSYSTAKENLIKFASFDYEAEKAALESESAQLPKEDNFVDFVNDNFKEILLQNEHKTFVSELQQLTDKHPEIGEDTAPLIVKYSPSSESSQTVDIAAQAEYFKKSSKRKQQIQECLTALEVKNVEYKSAVAEEKRLREEGVKARQAYDKLFDELSEIRALGEEAELLQTLNDLKAQKQAKERELESAKEKLTEVHTAISAEEAKAEGFNATVVQKQKVLQTECAANGFESVATCSELLEKYGTAESIQAKTDDYFTKLLLAQNSVEMLKKQIDVGTMSVTNEQLAQMKAELTRLRQSIKDLHGAIALSTQNAEKLQSDLVIKQELQLQLQKEEHTLSLLQKMRELVGKDKFMEFIAVEYLQDIASGANNLLTKLTGGRYFLTYGDKNFEVGDNYNGGQTRGVHTLSGGEVFLVSLSLALSLSEMIHCKSLRPIEFFFLDEGFGTLDEELIDVVMTSLEKLKNENFSIGVISHVGELKSRLENKIIVKKASEERGSSIEIY